MEVRKKSKRRNSYNEQTVVNEIHDIKTGAGWASYAYIAMNPDTTEAEKKEIALRLAKAGLLFDDEKIPDLESDDKPTIQPMTAVEVLKLF